MANQPHNEDPELDDILSQIMRPGSSAPIPPPVAHKLPPEPKHVPKKVLRPNMMGSRRRSIMDEPAAPVQAAPRKKSRRKVKRGFKRFVTTLLVLIVGGALGYFLYTGPLSSLLSPSPFSAKFKSSAKFDLYYPATLPPGYHVDKKTLKTTAGTVVVYSITNDKKNIAITQQALPPGLDLKNLLANYKDVKKLTTPVGVADVGIQNDTTYVAHILTPKTWVIMNTGKGTMSREAFNAMVMSLKQG